jgi:chaperonin GroEL (HSP60 family)
MVSADLGIKLENVTVNMLGRAKKVMIDKENTTIVSGAGKKADIQARITQIKAADRGNHLGLRPRAGQERRARPG